MLELAGQLGIAAVVQNRDPHPATLGFLPGIERITTCALLPATYASDFDLALIMECPGLDRPGLSGLDQIPLLNIDHHLANEVYGDVNYVDEEAPAVGEMVLAMVEAGGARVTPAMATNLFTALVTDTGDFRYSNATPRAFMAASRLVAAGAAPNRIADALWEHVPARVLRLTAIVLETLELLAGGRLALMSCDQTSLERVGAQPEDTENLINLARSIDGVEVAVLLKAFANQAVRVSLRSRGAVDVQAVARSLGGGGHRNAAGCTLHSSPAGAREAVLAALWPLLES
jgi:phosphoesterase RecJ-like protein